MPPLFFFHPVETVNGFLLGGGWWLTTPPLASLWFQAIPACSPFPPRPLSSSLFRLRSITRVTLSSPKFHEKRLYRGRGHEQRFKAGSIRRLSYFYYRLVSFFLPLRFARTRIGLAAKNRRGGKAGELLRRGESSGWFRWVEKRRRKRGKVG